MASFNNKSSVAAVSSRKSGWDYFWREKRVEFQKGLPEGLGYDEAKKELKKRLKDAWNVLSGPEKNVYEARVSLDAPSVSNGAITSESQGGTVASTVGSSINVKSGVQAPCHAFFLGKSASKDSKSAKENSPVDNSIPKFNLDAAGSSSKRSQKRRSSVGHKTKDYAQNYSVPRQFTSIRDSSSSSSSSSSSNSDKITSCGGEDSKVLKNTTDNAGPKHHFFMTKEEKNRYMAEKRREQEEEEARKRMQEIRDNERRQQEKMEELKARRKQDSVVFAAKGSGVNEFFVESERRIAKERALMTTQNGMGDQVDDDRVESWAPFPEVQNVGLAHPTSIFRGTNGSSSSERERVVLEKRDIPSHCNAHGNAVAGTGNSMVVDLASVNDDELDSSLMEKLLALAKSCRESRDYSAHGQALAEYGSSGNMLRGYVSAVVESFIYGTDRTAVQAMASRRAVRDAVGERDAQPSKNEEVVDLASESEDEDKDNRPVGCEGLLRPSRHVRKMLCDSNSTDTIVDLFQPNSSAEILGNDETKSELEQWLLGWAGRRTEKKKDKNTKNSKKRRNMRYTNYGDSEDESEEENILDNVAAVYGPSGSGKTALVYALAEQTGFNVIEIGASQLRSGAEINKQFQEAAKSHGLKVDASAVATPFSAAANATKSPASKQKLNLILFDEADIEFEEDSGMYKAMQLLIKTTRTPIIITAERLDRTDSPLSFLRSVHAMDCPMQRPTARQLGKLVLSILEHSLGFDSRPSSNLLVASLAASITQMHSGDVRACLHSLQTLVPSILKDKTALEILKGERSCGEDRDYAKPRGLASWLASTRACPIMMDQIESVLISALSSVLPLGRATQVLDETKQYVTAEDLSLLPRFCAPLISDLSPRTGPRKGGHVLRIEGKHFLQRAFQDIWRSDCDVGLKSDGKSGVKCLPIEVFIGSTKLEPENVSLLSDEILEVRVPTLEAGVHVVTLFLCVTSSMKLCSDVCGISNAWIRVRPPPGRGDIRSFLTERSHTHVCDSKREGNSLYLISDSCMSTVFSKVKSKSEYIDDSDDEMEMELGQGQRRKEAKKSDVKAAGKGKRAGGSKLVKGGRAKKARVTGVSSSMSVDQISDVADDGDEIVDSGDDEQKVEAEASLQSVGKKKRRVVVDSSDDEGDEKESLVDKKIEGEELPYERGSSEYESASKPESPSEGAQKLVSEMLCSDTLKACMEGSLDAIWDVEAAAPFLEPVNYLQCPDYSHVISRPLDLGTLKETITDYAVEGIFTLSAIWDFIADVRLVWSNCFEYNGDDAPLSRKAKMLSVAFDSFLKRELGEALREALTRTDHSDLGGLSSEYISLLKSDFDATVASLLPTEMKYDEIDDDLLVEHGLRPTPLSQTTAEELDRHFINAEDARSTLRKRAKALVGANAGFECNDPESAPVDLFSGREGGTRSREGEVGKCAAMDYLAVLMQNWSDVDLFDTHASLAPSRDGVFEQFLHGRSSTYSAALLSSEASARMMERSLHRINDAVPDKQLCDEAVNAFANELRSCERLQQHKKGTESSLVEYLRGSEHEDSDTVGLDVDSTDSSKECRVSRKDEDDDEGVEDEEEEFEFDSVSPKMKPSSRAKPHHDDRAASSSAVAEWTSIGAFLEAPSLRLPLQQHFYTEFVCKTLVPEYRYTNNGKGPQRRIFDNACLDSRVSREIALDAFPLISAILRADGQAPFALSERTSRRSMAAAGLQRYSYFYARSNDMDTHDMELIMALGMIH